MSSWMKSKPGIFFFFFWQVGDAKLYFFQLSKLLALERDTILQFHLTWIFNLLFYSTYYNNLIPYKSKIVNSMFSKNVDYTSQWH